MSSAKTKEERFISYLESKAEDRAALAALRRGLGQAPGTVQSMYPYVERFAPNRYEMASFYMIASLFALHPSPTAKSGNMGHHMRVLAAGDGSEEATERRFVQLLRMRRDTLEPRLRQQISILKSKGVPVHWFQLLKDVGNWDHPDHFVQPNWARAFWYRQSESENE